MDAIRLAFRRFVQLIAREGRLVVGADSPAARDLAAAARCPVETFGLSDRAEWRAVDVVARADGMTFRLLQRGRRVFEREFPRALAVADRVLLAAVRCRTLPDEERLRPERVVADLGNRGVADRYVPEEDAIVALVASEAQSGDVVVAMSNGPFDGLPDRLVHALAARRGTEQQGRPVGGPGAEGRDDAAR